MNWTPGEIRRRRSVKGWSQEQLANTIGVSRRAITNWESGTARPSGVNIEALDTALGDAPVPEVTLTGATDMQLLGELARRLGAHTAAQAPEGGVVELPPEDLGWPRRDRKTRRTHRDTAP